MGRNTAVLCTMLCLALFIFPTLSILVDDPGIDSRTPTRPSRAAGGEGDFSDFLSNPPMVNNTEKSTYWNTTSSSQFEQGFLINCEVMADELTLTPSQDYGQLDSADPDILCMAAAEDGTVVCGMASGKVIAKNPFDGSVTYLYNNQSVFPGERNISAITFDGQGRIWGACADNGKLFILYGTDGGNRTEIPALFPDDHLIRTLLYVPGYDVIWGGTAIKGYLFKIQASNQANQTFKKFLLEKFSIDCLVYDSFRNMIYAGTGLSYDIPPPMFPPPPRRFMFSPDASDLTAIQTENWDLAGDGIYSMTLLEDRTLFLGCRGPAKIITLDLYTQDYSVTGSATLNAGAVTSMVYGDMSRNIYGTTSNPGQIFTYNEYQGFSIVVDQVPDGGTAYINLAGNDEMIGMWVNSFPKSHLLRIVPIGLWISPLFNATETAIWDRIDLQTKLPNGNYVVFGLARYFNDPAEMNITDLDETNFIFGTQDLTFNDSTYLQIALILQTYTPFEEANRPVLMSVNVTLDYYAKLDASLSCGSGETVRNGMVDYTLSLNNTGNGTVSKARAEFPLPEWTTVYNSSHSYSIEDETTIVFDLVNISRGAEELVQFSLQVDQDAPEGQELVVQVGVNYSGIRNRYGPETSTGIALTKVYEPHLFAALHLDRTRAGPGARLEGDLSINYSVGEHLSRINVTIPLAPVLTFLDASGQWTIFKNDDNSTTAAREFTDLEGTVGFLLDLSFEIDQDAADNIQAQVRADIVFIDGLGINQYETSSEPVNISIVRPIVNFDLWREPRDEDFVQMGQTVSFFLEYSNSGHDRAEDVRIEVFFDDNLVYQSPEAGEMSEILWDLDAIPAETFNVVKDFELKVATNSSDPRDKTEVWAKLTYNMSLDGVNGTAKVLETDHIPLEVRRPKIEAGLQQTDEDKGIIPGEKANIRVDWENRGTGHSKTMEVTLNTNDPDVLIGGSEGQSKTSFTISNLLPGISGSRELVLYAREGAVPERDLNIEMDVSYTDAYGNHFTTIDSSVTIYVRVNPALVDPFKVERIEPPANATGVSLATSFEIWFNSPLDTSSIDHSSIRVDPETDYSIVVEENATKVRIKFSSSLEYDTRYTITVTTSIKDIYGRSLDSDHITAFNTEVGPGKEEKNNLVGPCFIILLLVLVAAVILFILVMRRKKMEKRLEELRQQESEAEEPDIVYAPEIETVREKKPRVARAKPISKRTAEPESAVVAQPVASGEVITSSTDIPEGDEPAAEALPEEQAPAGEEDPGDEMSLDDPYSVDLGLLRTPGTGPDGKPVLALPPAVFLDIEEQVEETPYSIDEIFVMTIEGILVQHFTAKGSSAIDEDILAGMLTAVQMFIKDTFAGSRSDSALDELSMGDFKIMIGRGNYLTISVIIGGEQTGLVRPQLDALVEEIETKYKAVLETWDGDMALVGGIKDNIKGFVEGKYRNP